MKKIDEPAEDSENKVEDEERSSDDESAEIDPRPFSAHCIVHLHVTE